MQVPMQQTVWKYLWVKVNSKVYQFTCLLFRLATSPREFTKLLRRVALPLCLQGIKLHVCLGDAQVELHAQVLFVLNRHAGQHSHNHHCNSPQIVEQGPDLGMLETQSLCVS